MTRPSERARATEAGGDAISSSSSIASVMVLGGALGVVLRTGTRCTAALSLVLTLFGVAVHFVAMEAHFLAAVQVIVYAGAIVVLFLFVIMLLGVDTGRGPARSSRSRSSARWPR